MNENKQQIDCLKKFGIDFQIKCIACLLSNKQFLEQILDILNPEYWENDASKWIVSEISQYFLQYKDVPTLTVFKVKIDQIDNELLKKQIVDQLRNVYTKLSDKDINYVKEIFLEFCKNQSLKNAMLVGVEYLKTGEYEKIRSEIDKALKAGAERNLGTDFYLDKEKWLSDIARSCVKTGWELIDSLLDGGLGAGELGVIISSAGGGKCVGPNTEIEIEYEEIGIPIIGNSGNEYILWINPLEKYEFNDTVLYGWQIHNFFDIVDNFKKGREQENLKK